LCFSCNVAVGQLQHDPARIVRAADDVDDDPERAELEVVIRTRARDLTRAASG
jgi:hypothetical protein